MKDLLRGGAAVLAACVGGASTSAWAQCQSDFLPITEWTNGNVLAIEAMGPDIYLGGTFWLAGSALANRVARWDGAQFHALGTGISSFSGQVRALRAYNGAMIAGGTFTAAGGTAALNIALWTGTAWQPMGAGLSDPVTEMIVWNNELLVVASTLRRWNGTSWALFGGAVPAGIKAIGTHAGELFLSSSPGFGAGAVHRWTGSSWQSIGSVNPSGAAVLEFGTHNGALIATGGFDAISGVTADSVARWTGSAWQSIGSASINGAVTGLATHFGQLVIAGPFSNVGGQVMAGCARWDGASWQPMGSGVGATVEAVRGAGGRVYFGGTWQQHWAAWGCVCYPDCNSDGARTVADFGCYQTQFVAHHPYADCNEDGQWTVADFGCYQTRFVAGCP